MLDTLERYLNILKTDDSTPESMSPRRITGFVLWASRAFYSPGSHQRCWRSRWLKMRKNKELQRKSQFLNFKIRLHDEFTLRILTLGVNFFLSGNHHQFSGAVCWGPTASLHRVGTSCNRYLTRSHFAMSRCKKFACMCEAFRMWKSSGMFTFE